MPANTDSSTLKNISATNRDKMFLVNKPQIGPVGSSSVLERLKSFLPEMEAANSKLGESSTAGMDLELVEERNESSDDESTSDSSSDDECDQTETSAEDKQSKCEQRIEMKLNLFRSDESVEAGDIQVQSVSQLPDGFKSTENSQEDEKKLIEEL